MKDYIIAPEKEGKGRSFQAVMVAAVTASALFEEGSGENIRPAWALFAGAEASLRPYMANLRLGRRTEPLSEYHNRRNKDGRVEFLKSVRYQITWQREEEGSLATIYHPELFRQDPGMVDPDGIKFVILSTVDWEDEQRIDTQAAVAYVRGLGHKVEDAVIERLAKVSYLFAIYLDRRTRMPLLADGRFYLQILCAALKDGHACFPRDGFDRYQSSRDEWGFTGYHGFKAVGLEDAGIRNAISFKAGHAEFEQFLAEQVAIFRRSNV